MIKQICTFYQDSFQMKSFEQYQDDILEFYEEYHIDGGKLKITKYKDDNLILYEEYNINGRKIKAIDQDGHITEWKPYNDKMFVIEHYNTDYDNQRINIKGFINTKLTQNNRKIFELKIIRYKFDDKWIIGYYYEEQETKDNLNINKSLYKQILIDYGINLI